MKILNFGSINIDITYRVEHFVRPGETMSAKSVTKNAGGKGFNQSVALAKAGFEVYHAGHIGSDGKFLLDLCKEYGVHTDYLTEVDIPTGNAMIQVDDAGDNCILLYGGANNAMDTEFIAYVLDGFVEGDIIVLQNEINCMNEILQMAHDKGLKIAINPAPMNDAISREALALADWMILNEVEAYELTNKENEEEQLASLSISFPQTNFLLTYGVRGSIYQTCEGHRYAMGSCKVNAVDTTAAGDTFAGFFLSTLIASDDPETALQTATKASALTVSSYGAAQSIPTLEMVQKSELIPGQII